MDWLEQLPVGSILLWLSIVSIASVALGALFLPRIVARMPSDYFEHDRRPPARTRWSQRALQIGRNALGVLLVLVGILLLVLPGQGVLTILAGIVITDVPGKRRAERWLFRRPSVSRPLNWLRKRAGVPPFGGSPDSR